MSGAWNERGCARLDNGDLFRVEPLMPLDVETQNAVLTLLTWVQGKELIDHGYNVSKDLRLVLGAFLVTVDLSDDCKGYADD